jgi:ubiquitin C-terminal hydrolase
MLKVPIPGSETAGAPAPTLDECIKQAFHEETLDDYACDKCKTRGKATQQVSISKLPDVVIIQIKRFTNMGRKVNGLISWSTSDTDLSPYTSYKRDPYSNTPMDTHYTTLSVIDHMGGTGGGHYKMCTRQEGTWLEYDDGACRVMDPAHVVSPHNYILVMMRTTALERHFTDGVAAIRAFRDLETRKKEEIEGAAEEA